MVFLARADVVTFIWAGTLLVVVGVINAFHGHYRRRKRDYEIREGLISRHDLYLRDLPQVARDLIFEEARRERSMKVEPPVVVVGWGREGSEFEGVNFRSAVLESVHVIDRHVQAIDPEVHTQPPEPVREFLLRVKNRFPQLTVELIDSYMGTYTRARFPRADLPVKENEYKQFVRVLFNILAALKDP